MQDTLASLVIVQFPCELASAVIAGRWAAAGSPFLPWRHAYLLRTLAGIVMTLTVMLFPGDAKTFAAAPASFAALTAASLLTSFSSTLMFTAMGTFFNRISDPGMGGAYLTMLNTIMNIGITLPQVAVFALVDMLSANVCTCAPPPRCNEPRRCPPAHTPVRSHRRMYVCMHACLIVPDPHPVPPRFVAAAFRGPAADPHSTFTPDLQSPGHQPKRGSTRQVTRKPDLITL